MNIIEETGRYIPESPSEEIPWDEIERGVLSGWLSAMKTTQQNPVYHGEGDVYTHTRAVCGKLVRDPLFHSLNRTQKAEVFLAAVLHDAGKTKTTRLENGEWISPHHASAGSRLVRTFLWKDCGLCGTPEAVRARETVCALVRWHMLPVHLMRGGNPEPVLRSVASVGELAPDFDWSLLCMLAEADVRGRIAEDVGDGILLVKLAGMAAEDAGCLNGPYPFADSFTKHAYLSGRSVQPSQALFDDTWGEVILMSGLPGTGKDTWIRENRRKTA